MKQSEILSVAVILHIHSSLNFVDLIFSSKCGPHWNYYGKNNQKDGDFLNVYQKRNKDFEKEWLRIFMYL